MKKYFMVFFMVLLANTLSAQIGFGTKVDFASLNGMVYNPGTHDLHYDTAWVTDRTNDELSFSEIANYNYMIEENHPGHIILSDATVTYNCHGYTFGIVQGTDRYNISWRADLCNNAFEIITTTPQPGDIAVMRYNNGVFDSPHSGIVVNQDTLISKWGRFPLTKHHKDSVIFITAYEIGQAYYTYYRRVINTPDDISGPSIFNGTGTYTLIKATKSLTCATWPLACMSSPSITSNAPR